MSNKITYKDAGVDVELADRVIGSLADKIKSTFRPEVIGKMGGFAAMFRPEWSRYREPVLVTAADGVGTKLKVAFLTGIHDTVGIDLVAMNVNDLVVTGAEPLFFLDYFATGALDPKTIEAVVSGIADGCRIAGCALIGGETAEMPDSYPAGEYDLAGFAVGMLDRSSAIDGSNVEPGHLVVGLASSGLHSNGFSLVRRVLLEHKGYALDARLPDLGKTLAEELLTPTTIYVKPILHLLRSTRVFAMAHITGGGFIGNIPRVLPEDRRVSIRRGSWDIPPIFGIIRKDANLDEDDMFRTFNMGVGFVSIVAPEDADGALARLAADGMIAWIIGEVEERQTDGEAVVFV